MDLFSHVLWTSVLARNRLWHDEAILFAMLPDLGYLLIMLYALFGTPMNVGFSETVEVMPPVLLVIYRLLHSFVVLGIAALFVWRLKPKLLPAMSAWGLHICMDIPFHDGTFGTRFLYPLFPDLYISGITWADFRVVGCSYLLLLSAWLYLETRELRKHRRREKWIPDWIDNMESFAGGLINPKPIPAAHAAVGDRPGASAGIPGEDQNRPGEGEDSCAGAVPPP